MAEITSTVGAGSQNSIHDVVLIQTMLHVVLNARKQPYFPHHADGACGAITIGAIKSFQVDQGTTDAPARSTQPVAKFALPELRVSTPGIAGPIAGSTPATSATRPTLGVRRLTLLDDPGVIKPGGPTFAKLQSLLPAQYSDIRSAPGLRFVYWPGSAENASATAKTIADSSELHASFRVSVAALVRRMFEKYAINLSLTPSGGRRTFQKQYELKTGPGDVTNAGPGESNHNFGQAVDIGFNTFKWISPAGTIVIDDWWLNKMHATQPAFVPPLWKLRDAIAYGELGMFRSNKEGDDIHIQRYSDDDVSARKSLAKLLNTAGSMSWQLNQDYECNLGFAGGTFRSVGKATQIWDRTGPMQKAWIASGRGVAVSTITDQDVRVMRDALRADFNAAETARDSWSPEPK